MVCQKHNYIVEGAARGLSYDVAQLPQMKYDVKAQDLYLEDNLYDSQPELQRSDLQRDNLTDSIARVVGNISENYLTLEDTDKETNYDMAQSPDTVDAVVSSVASDVPNFSSQVVNEVSDFIDSVVSGTNVSDVAYDNGQDQSSDQPINVYVVLNELGAPAYAAGQESEEDSALIEEKENLAAKIREELGVADEQQDLHNHQYAHDQLMGEQLMLYH